MKTFLKNLTELLSDKGYFLVQVVNWDKFRQTGSLEFPIKTLVDGRTFHRRYELTEKSTVIFHTELRKDGEILNSWSDTLYPIYLNTFRQDISEAGMTIIGVFGDYQKSPFDPLSSPALILVAQKG
jgi:hypothetical protein